MVFIRKICNVVAQPVMVAAGRQASYGFLILLTVVGKAIAEAVDEPDVLSVYAAVGMEYDSNVFRYSNEEEALAASGNAAMSARHTFYGAGAQANLMLGRQQVRVDGNVTTVEFDRFDFLDYTGGNVAADWGWEVGKRWNGDVGYRYLRTSADFEEEQRFTQDIRTERSRYVSGHYLLRPSWSLGGEVRRSSQTHSETGRQLLNRESDAFEIQLRHLNTANTYLGVRLRYIDTTFTERSFSPGASLDDGYVDVDLSIIGKLEPVTDSYLTGYIGYTRREYDHLGGQDFFGLVTSLSYAWPVTNKVRMNVSVWRELDPVESALVDHIVQQGVSVEPGWMATEKVTVTGRLLYELRDRQGDGNDSQNREDEISRAGLTLAYRPIDSLAINVSAEAGHRDSEVESAEYTYRTFSLEGRLSF